MENQKEEAMRAEEKQLATERKPREAKAESKRARTNAMFAELQRKKKMANKANA